MEANEIVHWVETLQRRIDQLQRDATTDVAQLARRLPEVLGELQTSLEELKAARQGAGQPSGEEALRQSEERKLAEEALERRNRELALYSQVSQAFNSTLDLDHVLTVVLEETCRALKVIASSVWLSDPETGEVVCRQATGPLSDRVRGWRLAPGEGIAGWVARRNQYAIVPDALADERYFRAVAEQIDLPLRSILSVPLAVKGKVIGALHVVDTTVGRFDAEDLALLEPLASAAAIAIENARLYEAAQRGLAERMRAETQRDATLQALRESEERYRRITEAVTDYIYSVRVEDGQHVETTHGAACVGVTGYTREEFAADPFLWLNMVDERDRQAVLEQARRVLAGESIKPLEHRITRKDGTQRWVRNTPVPHFDLQGKLLAYDGLIHDITERRQAEEEIRRQAETLSALHETALDLAAQRSLPDLLQAIVIRAINLLQAKMGSLFFYRPETDDLERVVAYSFDFRLDKMIRRRGEGLVGKVLESGRPLAIDDYNRWEGRAEPFVEDFAIVGMPIFWGDRLLAVLDISDRMPRTFSAGDIALLERFAPLAAAALENNRLVNDLQQQMEQLKATQTQLIQAAKLAAVGELAAGVAHELNNPLTSVLGFAELSLTDPKINAPLRHDLETIAREAVRARDIVRNLLDFARQTKPQRLPTDVNQVLKHTLDLIRQHIEKSGVIITEDYAPDVGLLTLDSGQIKQVFLNLITNAAQAMPRGGKLGLRTTCLDGGVAISVSDTGQGIPPEIQDRIFEPFFTTKAVGEGTGLGLSVSFGIIQEHGGRISVESQVGQGSTFTVWLPVDQAR